jgi:hypothetical protein
MTSRTRVKVAVLMLVVAALSVWAYVAFAIGQPQYVTMGHPVPPGYSGGPSLAP